VLSFEEALGYLSAGHSVPLVRRLTADLLTPLGVLLRLQQRAPDADAFLFESVERGETIGRYSYVGVEPENPGSLDATDFRTSARSLLGARIPEPLSADLPRFAGGLVFGLDWEYIRDLEPRLGAPEGPVAHVGLYREIVAFDHLKQTIVLVHVLVPGADAPADAEELRAAYDRGAGRLDALTQALDQPLPSSFLKPCGAVPGDASAAAVPDLEDEPFAERVARIQEWIRAGDAFQVVLARGFEQSTLATGLDLYRALRVVNPSPYMFYLKTGSRELAGASPEMLVRVEETGEVTTHPIAGTRRRGANAEEDRSLAAELAADPKERAEHAMLVDLARNDLGRVCEAGTIRLERHMEVERFSHVMHMVSEVRGQLRPDLDPIHALDACFPAGTVSGAPKVRAIEILHELEPQERGPYAGAVGSLGFTGALDTCIAIRTAEARSGRVRWQAGAGIVIASRPEREAEETREKGLAVRRALAVAEHGLSA
jgi:anthranilate synthase component 1